MVPFLIDILKEYSILRGIYVCVYIYISGNLFFSCKAPHEGQFSHDEFGSSVRALQDRTGFRAR